MPASVRQRFVASLGANIARGGLNFATGLLLARGLGPEQFGEMAFLIGTFQGVRQLLDMGTSTAFFTFLSQRERSRHFVRYFMAWLGLQFLVSIALVGLLLPGQWVADIWQGEDRLLVLLALIAVFMQYHAWPIASQIGEAQRRTYRVQAVGLLVALLHGLVVLSLWLGGGLGLYLVFAAIAVEYLIASLWVYRGAKFPIPGGEEDAPAKVGQIFFSYCLPLIPYAWVSFAYEFADRWLLQQYGGAREQAYYAVAAQFAMVALIATMSVLRIFWKEIAEAQYRGDKQRVETLFRKTSRSLFFLGAVIAGLMLPWSGEILTLMLGPAYSDGKVALAIMFLYPIHQSLGQITGSFLYATERTGLQVKAGLVFMLCSIAVTYVVLAPGDALMPGFGLAATGLALKMVSMQFIQVNVVNFLIARNMGWRFDWHYQVVGLSGVLLAGWVCSSLARASGLPFPLEFVISGTFYFLFMSALLYFMPSLVGLGHAELKSEIHRGYAWLAGRRA